MIQLQELPKLWWARKLEFLLRHVCFFFSNLAPELVPRIFGRFSSRKLGWNFSYEPMGKIVPATEPAQSTGSRSCEEALKVTIPAMAPTRITYVYIRNYEYTFETESCTGSSRLESHIQSESNHRRKTPTRNLAWQPQNRIFHLP